MPEDKRIDTTKITDPKAFRRAIEYNVAQAKKTNEFRRNIDNIRYYGPIDNRLFPNINWEKTDYAKASRGTKNFFGWGNQTPRWSKMSYDYTLEAAKDIAINNQNGWNQVYDTISGFAKNTIAGGLSALAAWDISNHTDMSMEKEKAQYNNWLQTLANRLHENAAKENKIYYDENNIWSLNYMMMQGQQLGTTAGMLGEALLETLILAKATAATFGGTSGALTASIAKNLAKLGQGVKLFQNTAKTVNVLNKASNVSKVVFNAGKETMKEIHMNAMETYNNTYRNAINNGESGEMAHNKATKAANIHYNTERNTVSAINFLQNVVLFGSLNKAGKGLGASRNRSNFNLSMGISGPIENTGGALMSKLTKNKYLQGAGKYAFMMGAEAFEEGVQTGIGIYAQNKVNGIETSINKIINSTEFRDSVIGGALGGGLMKGIFSARQWYKNKKYEKNYTKHVEDIQNATLNYIKEQSEINRRLVKAQENFNNNPTEENKQVLLDIKKELNVLQQHSFLANLKLASRIDYQKGGDGDHLYNNIMTNINDTLTAMNNKDAKFLSNLGLLDENGNIKDEAEFNNLKKQFERNKKLGESYYNHLVDTLNNTTNNFDLANRISLYKLDVELAQEHNDIIKKASEDYINNDPIYQNIQNKERYKLVSELKDLKEDLLDTRNDSEVYKKLLQNRIKEVEEALNNMSEFDSKDQDTLDLYGDRAGNMGKVFSNVLKTDMYLKSAQAEVLKFDDPSYRVEEIKKIEKEKIEQAKTLEELKKLEEEINKEAKEKDPLDAKANEEIKEDLEKKKEEIREKEVVSNITGKKVQQDLEPFEHGSETVERIPIPQNKKKAQEIKEEAKTKVDPTMGLFSSMESLGGKLEVATGFDNLEEIHNALSDNLDSKENFEESKHEKLKKGYQELEEAYKDSFGKNPTFSQVIEFLKELYGAERVQNVLPHIIAGAELNGVIVPSKSHIKEILFGKTNKVMNLFESLAVDFNTEEQVKEDNITEIDDNLVVPKNSLTVDRGTNRAGNKIAITNDYNRETGRYRQAETLVGQPDTNTHRYHLKVGEKLHIALVDDYENAPVQIIDNTDKAYPKRTGITLPFKDFMEALVKGDLVKYGYPKVEKNDPIYKNIWMSKVPMAYYKIDPETNEPLQNEMVAYIHDTEWWNVDNVDQREDPAQIISDGKKATFKERKNFFEKGKNVSEVVSVDMLGQEMLLEVKNESGEYVPNVDNGPTSITLEEATGDTRLGVIDNNGNLKLQDGTVINPNSVLKGTQQKVILNTKLPKVGTIIEVRKIKDTKNGPVYKVYTPVLSKQKESKKLNDKSKNIVKYSILSLIYERTDSQAIKDYLRETYGIDNTYVKTLKEAYGEARLGNTSNWNDLLSNFVMLSDSFNKDLKYTQVKIGPNNVNIFSNGKYLNLNFKQQEIGNTTILKSTDDNIKNFINSLMEQVDENNVSVLDTFVPNVKTKSLPSKGTMFSIDENGKISSFESKHGENTYAGYTKSIVTTSVKSFKAMEQDSEGNDIWITDIQPRVIMSNSDIEGNLKAENTSFNTDINDKVEDNIELDDDIENDVNNSEEDINEQEQAEEIDYDYLAEEMRKLGLEERDIELQLSKLQQSQVKQNYNKIDQSEELLDSRNEFSEDLTEEEIQNQLDIPKVDGVSFAEFMEVVHSIFNEASTEIQIDKENNVDLVSIKRLFSNKPVEVLNREIAKLNKFNSLYSHNAAFSSIIEKNNQDIKKLESILNNKEILSDYLDVFFYNLTKVDLSEVEIADYQDNAEGKINNENLIGHNYGQSSLTKDVRLSYSIGLKLAFLGIENTNQKGQKVSGALGLPIYVDPTDSMEILQSFVINSQTNVERLIQNMDDFLQEETENKFYANVINQLKDKIKSLPKHIQNEMMYKMYLTPLNMEMIFIHENKDGSIRLSSRNTNSNELSQILKSNFKSNFFQSEYINQDKDLNRIVDKEKLGVLVDRISKLKDSALEDVVIKKEHIDEALDILKGLGINLSYKNIESFWSNGALFNDKNLFGLLKKQAEEIIKDNNVYTIDSPKSYFITEGQYSINSILDRLIANEIKLTSYFYNPSQRVNGDTYPGLVQRGEIDNLVEGLTNPNSTYFKFLKNSPIAKGNFMLDIMENTSFLEDVKNFYVRVSPGAIKETTNSKKDANSLEDSSVSDRLLVELGFFINSIKENVDTTSTVRNNSNLKFRVGRMFAQRVSDKDQTIAVAMPLVDINDKNLIFGEDLNDIKLGEDLLKLFRESLFESEFNRIVDRYLGNSSSIVNYEEASKFFIGQPSLNYIDVDGVPLWKVLQVIGNEPGATREDFELVKERISSQIDEALQESFKTSVNKEFSISTDENGTNISGNFVDNSIITKDDKGNVIVNKIDTKYLQRKHDNNNRDKRLKTFVADFVFNNIVSKANMTTMFLGDMAFFAKGQKSYLKDDVLDAAKLAKDASDNLTKRIAGLIAPGSNGANSSYSDGSSKTYTQIFINDTRKPSSSVRELVNMYHNNNIPQEQEDLLKKIENENSTSEDVEDAFKKLGKLNPQIKSFFDIEGTDAQEYVTWKEHLDNMLSKGIITEEKLQELSEKIENDTISKEELKFVFNPIKPVYYGNVLDENIKSIRPVYVKSSAMPLLPQLTRGLEIDNIRLVMEETQKVTGQNVRMSYQTANKVGAVKTTLTTEQIFNLKPEEISNFVDTDIKNNSLNLNRMSFKIQQETPYKSDKYKKQHKDTRVTKGIQIDSLLLASGINKMRDVFSGHYFSDSMYEALGIKKRDLINGQDLEKFKIHSETLYQKLLQKQLDRKFGIENRDINSLTDKEKVDFYNKLVREVRKILNEGTYDDVTKKSLLESMGINPNTGKPQVNIPVWLTENSNKIESVFMSIVKNKMMAISLPGNAHIVGSSEGFEKIETWDKLPQKDKEGIIWLDKNKVGDLKSSIITYENGKKKLRESEVLIQSHFRQTYIDPKTKEKVTKIIDMTQYVNTDENGNKYLDTSKIDDELLTIFSFRTPSSSLQSGAILKIVGFLPESSGDLLIVPDEHTKQIGEDYDIDKRNLYKNNYFIDRKGNIKLVTFDNLEEYKQSLRYSEKDSVIEEEHYKKAIENMMINIYKAVYQSSSEDVQKKIYKTLSMEVAANTAKFLNKTLVKNNEVDLSVESIYNHNLQSNALDSSVSGAIGISIHSKAVTTQAMLEKLSEEDKVKIVVKKTTPEGVEYTEPKVIVIGSLESDGVLGKTTTLDKNRDITDVHAENQNSALDNIKELIMAARNENKHTIGVLVQMTNRGFDQVKTKHGLLHLPSLFLSQPIIKEYVDLMNKKGSIVKDADSSGYLRDDDIIKQLKEKYKIFTEGNVVTELSQESYDKYSQQMTGDTLIDNLTSPTNHIQLAVLQKFLELKEENVDLLKIQNTLSAGSSGFGMSFYNIIKRIKGLNEIAVNSKFENASKLIGEYKSTEEIREMEKNGENIEDYVKIGLFYWKPTTTEGVNLIYPLAETYKLLNQFFPYNDDLIVNILDKIETTSGRELSDKEVFSIFNSFKEFLKSNSNNNLWNINPELSNSENMLDEKNRLLNFETKKSFFKDPNIQIKSINKTNDGRTIVINRNDRELIIPIKNLKLDSPGDVIKIDSIGIAFKVNREGNIDIYSTQIAVSKKSLGMFINDLINFRNEDGTLGHKIIKENKFLQLLSIENNYDKNISIIKARNNEKNSVTMETKTDSLMLLLADNTTDLGDWNGETMTPRKLAQDLINYSLLTSSEGGAIGFNQLIPMEYFNMVNYSVGDTYSKLEFFEDHTVEVFLRQYYQHNINKAPLISSESSLPENFNLASSMTSKEFDKFLGQLGDTFYVDKGYVLPKFFRVKNTNKAIPGKFKLYEAELRGPDLVVLNRLDLKGDFGVHEYDSNIITDNNDYEGSQNIVGTNLSTIPYSLNGRYQTDSIENFLKSLSENTNNPKIKNVLDLLNKYNFGETKVEFVNFSEHEELRNRTTGTYHKSKDTIYINLESADTAFSRGFTEREYLDKMESVIVEELLHAIHVKTLSQYGQITEDFNFVPNDDAPEYVHRLVNLYNVVKSEFPYDPSNQENYESKNFFEFLAGVFEHRDEYRDKLNKTFVRGKSVWDRLLQALSRGYRFIFGNDFTSDVKGNIVEIMNMTESVQKPQQSKSQESKIKFAVGGGRVTFTIPDKKETIFTENLEDILKLNNDEIINLLEQNGVIKKECN